MPDTAEEEGRRLLVVARIACDPPLRNPASEADFRTSFAVPRWKIVGGVRRKDALPTSVSDRGWQTAFAVQRWLWHQSEKAGPWGAVAWAAWTGSTEALSERIVRAYRETGLLPVLALSGQHVLALAILLQLLFRAFAAIFRRSPPLAARHLLPLLALLLFLTSGGAPSMLRTAGMATALWILRARRLFVSPLQLANSSLAALVCWQPNALAAPGFLLSAVGTIAALVLCNATPSQKLTRVLLAPTLVAVAMILPCAYLFGRGNLWGPIVAVIFGVLWDVALLPIAFATPFLAALPSGISSPFLQAIGAAWSWIDRGQLPLLEKLAASYGALVVPRPREWLLWGVALWGAIALLRSLPTRKRCNTIEGDAA